MSIRYQIVGEKLSIMKISKIKIIVDGILIPFAIYFSISLLVSFFIRYVLSFENENAVLNQGIANIFTFLALCPLYIIYRKNNHIETSKLSFGVCLYMIPLAFSICVIGNVIVDYIPRASENIVTTEVYRLAEEYNVFLSLFIISIIVPIIEELIFRGFFYDAVKLLTNDVIAIIFTSLAFAIAHVDFRQMLYALFAGFFLAYIRYKYKNVIYTILMHLLMNMITLVFIPSILLNNDLKSRLYVLFISFAMLFFTIYRINIKK